MMADERALIGLSDAQDVQMESQRSPCVIVETRDTALLMPPNRQRRRLSARVPLTAIARRAGNRQRQTALKLVTFMTAGS
jgi:hypothetical protein